MPDISPSNLARSLATRSGRKPIPDSTLTVVLLACRRRCCVCFGLNRDGEIKAGQVAHLDHNNANSEAANLAFLCFDHHDQYDSVTRQSRKLTIHEVRGFRDELTAALKAAFSAPVFFGSAKARAMSGIEGEYIRIAGGESAEVKITALPVSPGRYHVSGFAIWGGQRQHGPHTGELDFSADFENQQIVHESHAASSGYRIVLSFRGNDLQIVEEGFSGVHGMNVTFNGMYSKG